MRKEWTQDEKNYLLKYYNHESMENMMKVLQRTKASIISQAKNFGIHTYVPGWSKEDIEFLKTNYYKMNLCDIAKILNRSINTTYSKCRSLGMISKKVGIIYPKDIDDEIIRLYPRYGIKYISDITGYSNKHIRSRVQSLKLKRELKNKKLYQIWNGMIERCYNPNNKASKYFYKKGIKVCDEWMNDYWTFHDFVLSHGWKEWLIKIDRIDNKKEYCPENIKFIKKH
jgi:hypothetical protein